MILLIGLLSSCATPAVRVPTAFSLCARTSSSCRYVTWCIIWFMAEANSENSSSYFLRQSMGVKSPCATLRVAPIIWLSGESTCLERKPAR